MGKGILIAIEFCLHTSEVLPLLQVANQLALVCIDLVLLGIGRGHDKFSEIYRALVEVLLHPLLFINYTSQLQNIK